MATNIFLYGNSPEKVHEHLSWIISEFMEKTNVEGALMIVPQKDYMTVSIMCVHDLQVKVFYYIGDNLRALEDVRDLMDPDACILEEKVIVVPGKVTVYLLKGNVVSITASGDMTEKELMQVLDNTPFRIRLHGCPIDAGAVPV